MDLGLTGKKVVITGGSRGIGRAIATTMLEEGASEAICARGQEGVDEALAALEGKGTIIGAAVDASNGEELENWLKSSAEELGGIDILINNASGRGGGPTDEKFDEIKKKLKNIYGPKYYSEVIEKLSKKEVF